MPDPDDDATRTHGLSSRPMAPLRIGISACLLGARVRYDGGHRLNPLLARSWADDIQFIPFCPESECGLGTPREPMRLEGDARHPRLRTLHSRIDHTHRVNQWCRYAIRKQRTEKLSGYLLKSRSPSCGLTGVPVLSKRGEPLPGMGIFPRLVLADRPHLPLAEGDLLLDEEAVWCFLRQARGLEGNPSLAGTGVAID